MAGGESADDRVGVPGCRPSFLCFDGIAVAHRDDHFPLSRRTSHLRRRSFYCALSAWRRRSLVWPEVDSQSGGFPRHDRPGEKGSTMAQFIKIKDLAARKQALLAESELYRQTL